MNESQLYDACRSYLIFRQTRKHLGKAGAELVQRLTKTHSYRDLAAAVKLSPAYLCSIAKRRMVISPEAFVRLVEWERRSDVYNNA